MNGIRKGLFAIAALTVMALVAAGPAAAKDRNHDKIPDRWEKRHHLSLKVNQARRDQDRDGLNNRGEFKSTSDPRDDDTDDDGIEDGDENAGTVVSFDGTSLTINLLNGGEITGAVDEDTEIECDEDGDEGDGHHSGPGGTADRRDHGDDDEGDADDEEEENESEEEGSCSVDDLVAGAAIHEAELELEDGGAVFTEVELAE